ncbi:putative RNA-directed DNA polymerase [Tanacetum coccineum]
MHLKNQLLNKEEPINTLTYYFTSFPSNWDHVVMKDVFLKYGTVEDVFIVGKRNKQGKRFGFTRFKGVSNLTAFEVLLNTICIDTQKITCNLARFQRRRMYRHRSYGVYRSSGATNSHKQNTQPSTAANKFANSNKSYVDLFKSKPNLSNSTPQKNLNIQLTFPPLPSQSTFTSIIDELDSINDASNTHNLILDEGFEDFSIKYLAIFGLPPQLWLSNVFTSIAMQWGKVIIPEDCNIRQFNRTTDKVCILTNHKELISEIAVIPYGKELISQKKGPNKDAINSDDEGKNSCDEEGGDDDSHGDMADGVPSGEDSSGGNNPKNNMDKNNNFGALGEHKSQGMPTEAYFSEGSTSGTEHMVKKNTNNIPRSEILISCSYVPDTLCLEPMGGLGEDHKSSWIKRICCENENSLGKSGGILAVWDTTYFTLTDTMYGEGFPALLGTWRNLEVPCLLVVVYAPQDHHEKQILWNNLSQLIANYNNFSILLGDFNEVIFQSDRIGIVFDSGSASKFNNFIHYSGLSDLPLGGKRFTRMNNLGSKHREFSYHSPILLRNTSLDSGPIPFKLYNSWIEHVDFPIIVQESWVSSTSGPPAMVFKTKLKRLKNTIKQWRANVQQSESKSCCELRAKIDCLDNKAEISPLSPYEVDSRTSFLKQLADLEHHKVKDLKQKAKIRWAAKGDENSRFFHGIINNRCNRSTINGLNIHGEWITDLSAIKNHIFTSFGNRFKEENRSRPLFTSSIFQHLTMDEVHFLDKPFSLDEIKGAVWDCGSSKAPGPDGFTFKFFKKHWTTIERDVISYVRQFEVSGLIPRGCNSSFITLVLKVDDPLVVGDFRQISLIGCQYKIIAKILANRLSQVVSSVVSDVQMAYIKGRQIIDGPLMVDDIIAWAKKHKRRLMFLKVDFEKAFDSLSWSFLFSVLEQMRFSSKWRNWIHSFLNSAFALVLVNGSPTNEFKIERGLRQGDPLSPFLFILAVEALNVALFEATSNNIFHGIKVGKDKVHISHLQFADDALIMGEWSFTNAKNLSRILTCFQLASRLKVNFNKSKLYSVGVSNSKLNSLAETIGCLASQFPCIYLGLPIGAKITRCRNCNPLVDRFH